MILELDLTTEERYNISQALEVFFESIDFSIRKKIIEQIYDYYEENDDSFQPDNCVNFINDVSRHVILQATIAIEATMNNNVAISSDVAEYYHIPI